MLTVGDKFPEYVCQACTGNGTKDFTEITNDTYAGQWKVFLFYPKDFTFICPTELVEFGKKNGEFKDRDAVLLGGSTDNEYSHHAWRSNHGDLKDLPYPLLAANKLAQDLGILDPKEKVCLRATYIVDPHDVIQWASCNALSCGRSVPETLRILDAIQSDELCPCNWKQGEQFLKVG